MYYFRHISNNMTTLSKEEYLKRYLSGDATDSKDKKKKKKTKEKASAKIQPRMRIIDNDADVPSAAVPPSGETVKKVSFFFKSAVDPDTIWPLAREDRKAKIASENVFLEGLEEVLELRRY